MLFRSTVTNLATTNATLTNSGAGTSFTVTSSTPTDPVESIIWVYDPASQQLRPQVITTYQSLTIVVTSTIAADIFEGTLVKLAASSAANCDTAFGVRVTAILSTTSFQVGYNSQNFTAGTGGTAVVQQPSLIRANNIVTATTSAPHGYVAGNVVRILMAHSAIGGGISSISRDANGVVTVATASAHGLIIGSTVDLLGVTDPDTTFNVNGVLVASVVSSTVFTYQQFGTVEASGSGTGNVYDVWAGPAFFVQSVPSPTTFTYQNLGPNDQTNASGTAFGIGQISPGPHSFVVIFLTRQGALTKPSPPVIFYANGAQKALMQDLAIGPSNVVARLIGATGAGGANYFTIPAVPQVGGTIVGTWLVIPDNTSTSAVIDFADNTLFDGIAIDQIGNDLFDQRLLIAPVGFYAYSSRLFPWGDYNAVQNLLNMTFGGGSNYTQLTDLAGSGAQSGSGSSWTNPSYIADTGTSNYATVSVTNGSTKQLLAGTFGFAATGQLGNTLFASFSYYYTASGAGIPKILVQLLKAGVPVGSPQSIFLPGGSGGTSAAPLSVQLTFLNPGLVAADVNASTFGFQITVSDSGAGNSASVGVNAGYASFTETLQPLGWSTSGSTSATGGVFSSTLPGIYQVYEMLSAGGSLDCLLSQPAYQDASGTAILLPNTAYSIRALVSQSGGASTGVIVWDLYSPILGQLAFAQIAAPAIPLTASNPRFRLVAFNISTPATIPPDALLRLYLANVDTGVTISLAENALIYTAVPYAGNTAYASYVLNPEGIAQTTGLIGSADDPSPVMCFSVQRNVTLLKSYAGAHTFQDNGEEPYTWQVNNLSRSVGACSIRGGDPGQFGTGDAAEDWDVTVNQNGLYLFAGGDF